MSANIVIEPELYTAADLERFSQSGCNYELIRGELKAMTPAGGGHGNKTIKLSAIVTNFVLAHDLGECFGSETGFIVEHEPKTILAPDFAFIARARVPVPIPDSFVPVVPDLVLETRSPGDTARAVAAKVELWLEVGARVVWELNPRRRVLTVYRAAAEPLRLEANDVLYGDDVLPEFSLQLNRVLD